MARCGQPFLAGRHQHFHQLGHRQPFHPGLGKQYPIGLPEQGTSARTFLAAADTNPVAVKFQVTGKIRKSLPRPGSLGQLRTPSLGGCLQPSRIDRTAVRTQYHVKKLAGTIQDPTATDLQLLSLIHI